ncbi:MAG: DegV family protein [Oscillospiraceae bacterium]|nr:DegV family protein [Oscillospiraceae bacterium]
MSKIKITCDSTCDLTNELYQKNNITVVPLSIALGDEIRRDSIDIDADEIFRFVKSTNQLPKTSAISIGEYEDVFGKLVDEGYTVIHINISSELSSSHQNACLAAEDIGNIYVIDSRNLSSGSGHLVLLAAAMADSGMEAGEIVDILNEKKEKLDVSFVLQTLEYLHKGGRCSSVAAFGANALKLRPEIQVIDGKMQVGRKYRGDMEKTILAYVHGRLDGRDDIDTDRIFVTHSGVPEDILDKVVDTVKALHPFREVLITRAGCTISSHCGPACLGVLFFKK